VESEKEETDWISLPSYVVMQDAAILLLVFMLKNRPLSNVALPRSNENGVIYINNIHRESGSNGATIRIWCSILRCSGTCAPTYVRRSLIEIT
jgi:hypothetical protein